MDRHAYVWMVAMDVAAVAMPSPGDEGSGLRAPEPDRSLSPALADAAHGPRPCYSDIRWSEDWSFLAGGRPQRELCELLQ